MIECGQIIAAREAMNLTQMETSKRVGISYAMYRLWEKGISKPNPKNEKRLMEVLKLEHTGVDIGFNT